MSDGHAFTLPAGDVIRPMTDREQVEFIMGAMEAGNARLLGVIALALHARLQFAEGALGGRAAEREDAARGFPRLHPGD